MQCVACEGAGCDECNGRGKVKIESCPCELITSDVWQLASEAADAESGFLPVSGGMLDQVATWIDALRRYRAERSAWKSQLKVPDV